jgi:hypothetical protein
VHLFPGSPKKTNFLKLKYYEHIQELLVIPVYSLGNPADNIQEQIPENGIPHKPLDHQYSAKIWQGDQGIVWQYLP